MLINKKRAKNEREPKKNDELQSLIGMFAAFEVEKYCKTINASIAQLQSNRLVSDRSLVQFQLGATRGFASLFFLVYKKQLLKKCAVCSVKSQSDRSDLPAKFLNMSASVSTNAFALDVLNYLEGVIAVAFLGLALLVINRLWKSSGRRILAFPPKGSEYMDSSAPKDCAREERVTAS